MLKTSEYQKKLQCCIQLSGKNMPPFFKLYTYNILANEKCRLFDFQCTLDLDEHTKGL